MSLKELMENPQMPGRPYVVAELHSDTEDLALQGRMLRTPRYKYVAFSAGRDAEMLFDLKEDPDEKENLVREEGAREVLGEHRELLRQWCAQIDDDFIVPVVAS